MPSYTRRKFIKTLGASCALLPSFSAPFAYAVPELDSQAQSKTMKITIFSPSGAVLNGKSLTSAKQQLELLGAEVHVDESANSRYFGFAGTDQDRLAAVMRAALDDANIALAARGGYGFNRLLDHIDWETIAHSVEKGKQWCGHSDFTAFQLALLAHTGAPSWASPMAVSDFSLVNAQGKRLPQLDPLTTASFIATMRGELKNTHFNTEANFSGLDVQGMLWGGNLSMMVSLLGTPHFPKVQQGILFLEDINERPFRIERNLLQLHQAGILNEQKAIVLGDFGYWKPQPIDMNYKLSDVIDYIRSLTTTPILTGLQFGHVFTKVTLPVGRASRLIVDQHSAQILW